MKYYELTPSESQAIGTRFKIDDQNYIDATCGRLENGNFAIGKKALRGLKKINEIDFNKKTLKTVKFKPNKKQQ